jgi:hypothetical protein
VYSARIEPTGSASTNAMSGWTLRKKRVRPVSVPDEPMPTTIASTAWPVCCQISGPVPALVGERIGRVVELVGEERIRRVRERAPPARSW